eukprot:g1098.t1
MPARRTSIHSEQMKWKNLSGAQREAAKVAGFSAKTWNARRRKSLMHGQKPSPVVHKGMHCSPENSTRVAAPGSFSLLKGQAKLNEVPLLNKGLLRSAMTNANIDLRKKAKEATRKHALGSNYRIRMQHLEDKLRVEAKRRLKLQKKLEKQLDENFGMNELQVKKTPTELFRVEQAKAKKADEERALVEEELKEKQNELEHVMSQLFVIRSKVQDTNKKVTETRNKMEQLLQLTEELLHSVLRKADGHAFSSTARREMENTVFEPISNFFEGDHNIQSYIKQKAQNIFSLVSEWPLEAELKKAEHEIQVRNAEQKQMIEDSAKQNNVQKHLNDFSEWSTRDFQALKGNSARTENNVANITGLYKRHIVAEPPVQPHKHTRTAGIETIDGRFYMLGRYHQHDGLRPEEEIASCEGRTVTVSGRLHDWTPVNPADEDDILPALTPYVSDITCIEIIE